MTWLEYATERFGEPRIKPRDNDHWVRLHDCKRRAWAWFPEGKNHHIGFDVYDSRLGGGRVETVMGRNDVNGRSLTLMTTEMPTDEMIITLLDFVWGEP
jgi:hypothetical protein